MGSRVVKLRDEDGSGTAKAIQGELESAGESGGGEVISCPLVGTGWMRGSVYLRA
jgi:hypothetical protein